MAQVRFSAAPTPAYRLLRFVCAGLARLLFKVELRGLETLPRTEDGRLTGGWIAAALPHRNWSEPFLLFAILPARPRTVAVAESETVSGSPWRRMLIGAGGGVIPVGLRAKASGFHAIVNTTKLAVDAGAVVTIFPEAGPPSQPPEFRPLSRGVAHLAARTGAPVVPVVFGGSHELYLRKRIVVRVLPAVEPPRGTDRIEIADWMAAFRERCQVLADEVHVEAQTDQPRVKLARWLTGRYPRPD